MPPEWGSVLGAEAADRSGPRMVEGFGGSGLVFGHTRLQLGKGGNDRTTRNRKRETALIGEALRRHGDDLAADVSRLRDAGGA